MNDTDKEAFTQKFTFWINHYPSDRLNDWGLYELMKSAWQAACEYKQEEITLLENQISYLEETIDSFMDEPDIVIKKLQAENAELQGQLKSCIFVYEEKVDRLNAENQVLSVQIVLSENKVRQYQSTILELQERTLMIGDLELRINQADKIIKDRQDELNYLVNKVEELEGKLEISVKCLKDIEYFNNEFPKYHNEYIGIAISKTLKAINED